MKTFFSFIAGVIISGTTVAYLVPARELFALTVPYIDAVSAQ
jgi:hypothetical protein